jgi:hypothetical protein
MFKQQYIYFQTHDLSTMSISVKLAIPSHKVNSFPQTFFDRLHHFGLLFILNQ